MLWQLCSVEIWRAVYICTMFVKLRLGILSPQPFSIVSSFFFPAIVERGLVKSLVGNHLSE